MTLVTKINENSNEYMFAQEMSEIKTLLQQAISNRAYGKDLYMQFPTPGQATSTQEANSEITVYDTTINRILKFISVDVPDGITLEIYNGSTLWADYADSSGSMMFEGGVYFEVIKIIAKNTTAYPLRWSLKMVWE